MGPRSPSKNIRFLIEQISSKSRTKDSTGKPMTTGKFGTGFLTTHLLSPYVLVTGVAKQPGLLAEKVRALPRPQRHRVRGDHRRRRGAAKSQPRKWTSNRTTKSYAAGEFNTAFRYELTDDTGKNVAQAGLADLDICLPYTLASCPSSKASRTPIIW